MPNIKPLHKPRHVCPCLHPDRYSCLARRYDASLDLARIMQGCGCRCHVVAATGGEISRDEWLQNRQQTLGIAV
jgi:hypothetical protein